MTEHYPQSKIVIGQTDRLRAARVLTDALVESELIEWESVQDCTGCIVWLHGGQDNLFMAEPQSDPLADLRELVTDWTITKFPREASICDSRLTRYVLSLADCGTFNILVSQLDCDPASGTLLSCSPATPPTYSEIAELAGALATLCQQTEENIMVREMRHPK